MPHKIQNRYSALRRELELQDPFFTPELQDEVYPVVVLHEHCEGNFVSFDSGVVPGPFAGGQVGAGIVLPREGAYQIMVSLQTLLAIALAAGVVKSASFGVISGGNTTILASMFFQAAEVHHHVFNFGKLHFDQGATLAVFCNALLVNDAVQGLIVAQPA